MDDEYFGEDLEYDKDYTVVQDDEIETGEKRQPGVLIRRGKFISDQTARNRREHKLNGTIKRIVNSLTSNFPDVIYVIALMRKGQTYFDEAKWVVHQGLADWSDHDQSVVVKKDDSISSANTSILALSVLNDMIASSLRSSMRRTNHYNHLDSDTPSRAELDKYLEIVEDPRNVSEPYNSIKITLPYGLLAMQFRFPALNIKKVLDAALYCDMMLFLTAVAP